MADTLLTAPEVSAKTRLAEQTLANWRSLGKGPAWFKVGRQVRYYESVVDAWIAEQAAGKRAA